VTDPNINLAELISKLPLRSYQQLAIERVIDDFYKGHKKLLVEMEIGTGRTSVIASIIHILLQTNSVSRILFLASRRIQVEQARNHFSTNFPESGEFVAQDIMGMGVYFTTFAFINRHVHFQPYDIIMIDDAQDIKQDFKIAQFFDLGKCVIGFANHNRTDGDIGWFDDAKKSFKYTLFESLNEGYRSFERDPQVLYSIIKKIFAGIGYPFVDIDPSIFYAKNNEVRPDFLALHEDTYVLIEAKSYQGRYVSSEVIENAFSQIQSFKRAFDGTMHSSMYHYCLIMMCEIDEKRKHEFYDKTGIHVWDISNMLYFCEESSSLLNTVTAYLPFSITDIPPAPPIQRLPNFEKDHESPQPSLESIIKTYIQRLVDCPPGRENSYDIIYQDLCSEIIHLLFASEFIKESKQHRTEDDLFRMDMLCALKGAAEFWKFLIQFYNTKFVVFEFKNYAEPIPQNLIYTTEKYLFKPALRNVAFIISREGFDDHANDVALGCLKETGKLIIDITDEDLISMLLSKIDGKEPSDVLLDKTLNMLMSIGK